MQTPYLARVLISLLFILVVNKFLKELTFSVFIGTVTLALWSGHSINTIFEISLNKFSSQGSLFLMAVIFLVIWLSSQMSRTGVMKELVETVKIMARPRISIALLPAIIGLLPMPGGAIFSAPLVDEFDPEKKIDPLIKTKINYWFRHIWEFWWPLYPGVLLAVDLSGVSILQFMGFLFPMSIVSAVTGYFFLLRKIDGHKGISGKITKALWLKLVSLTAPIIIIILSFVLIKFIFPSVSSLNKYFPMIIGIVLAQIFLQAWKPLKLEEWAEIIFSKKTIILVLLVGIILIYGSFVESTLPDGSTLMSRVRGELASSGIPVMIIVILLPFISGITTGISVGFVGASFPIVMTLIGSPAGSAEIISSLVLAYVSGFIGVILSPVHVCLIVTNQHFKTGITASLARLILPASAVLAAAVVMYLIIVQLPF